MSKQRSSARAKVMCKPAKVSLKSGRHKQHCAMCHSSMAVASVGKPPRLQQKARSSSAQNALGWSSPQEATQHCASSTAGLGVIGMLNPERW